MKRWGWWTAGVAALALTGAWVSQNTYWADVQIPTPPKGEALTNPFYAVQRFAEKLGATTTRDRVLAIPSADAVMVLADWHWTISESRRQALERWVESGGRLVVVDGFVDDETEFEEWSGITREYRELEHKSADENSEAENSEDDDSDVQPEALRRAQAGMFGSAACDKYREQSGATDASAREYTLCGFDDSSWFTTERPVKWALHDEQGAQVLRVEVGRGTVTVINGAPFQRSAIFDGDHGWLFAASTDLKSGDSVHFLSEEEHPTLLALVWLYGRPVVLLGGVLIGLALWRGGVRFGPLVATRPTARRSLAEQIRGTGQFALRQGGGEALHTACVRALEEAAERRVASWHRLGATDRASQLAKLTGFDREALAAAIYHPGLRRPGELRSTIALLESARRLIHEEHRSAHGTS